jgi:hypothetical protein
LASTARLTLRSARPRRVTPSTASGFFSASTFTVSLSRR